MKKNLLTTLTFTLFVILTCPPVMANAQIHRTSTLALEELDLGISGTLKDWYATHSGLFGDADYFGAYITLPVTDELYIGLASARPAENIGDGAYLAHFDGTNLTGIGNLDEQGVHEMIWDGSYVHIAGTDPHNGDNWDAGNHYLYDPGAATLTKHRDPLNGLQYVIHTWGLWKDGDTLYAAASAHDGSYPSECTYGITCLGQIWSSGNNGITWTRKAHLGDYRAYDIIGYADDLYAIANDAYTGTLSLSHSSDGGSTWNTFPELTHNVRRSHMVEFDEKLIATSFDRAHLFSIDSHGQVVSHTLPTGYLIGSNYDDRPAYSDYHIMVTTPDYLYLIAEDQTNNERVILRTYNFSYWEEITRTPEKLISLSYWVDKNWLVTSSSGSYAKLWRVNLNNLRILIYLPWTTH